jgi:4-amino-4-deoxy-L-arabinose transferase-like glycosyltransferase
VACGLAVLVKEAAAFGLLGLLALVLVMPESGRLRDRARSALLVAVSAGVVTVGGLWVLDLRYTEFDDPFSHAQHMRSYGLDLSRETGPVNEESDPWQWLSNDVQLTYFRVNTEEVVGEEVVTTKPLVFFRGALNPALPGVALMALAYALWRWRRRGDVLAAWSILWCVGLFLPFLLLAVISHRISYLFYVLPLVPAYAVAATLMLWHEGLPRAPRWGFVAALVLGFLAYFPFREYLP